MLKKIFLGITLFIVMGVIIFGVYLVYMIVSDYKPADIISLEKENNQDNKVMASKTYSISTFNIGYCGLDKNQDFFMDGGKGSRSSSKEKTMDNLTHITEFLKSTESDFILIQEVDIKATRSFKVDQYSYMKEKLPQYGSCFAINYKVPWVPLPVFKPMGMVLSGLTTFSKYDMEECNRYKYPGAESFIRQLGELDRCMLESRMKVDNGKELILINSHLSAFDKGGTIRRQQLAFLKQYILGEYRKGNYIVVGGDWNHLIPGTDPNIFKATEKWPEFLQRLPEDFKPEGFIWAADKNTPSVRTDAMPYKKGVNFAAVIDGFLLSPNIEVEGVQGHPLEFEYSDHNPVTMKFKLK